MDTGIDEDYVIRIFDRLVDSDRHELFGLFQGDQMLAIGGYSLFGVDKFAMLGRLRSDRRYQKKGHATELLKPIVDQLRNTTKVKWIGANTHLSNLPARSVLERLGILQGPIVHYLILNRPELLCGNTPGGIWNKVTELPRKRELLHSIVTNQLNMFPYECYYPLPFDTSLTTDEYLTQTSCYQNDEGSRFVMITNDTKKLKYSHVKYFWNDHYEQAGFFETLLDHWKHNSDHAGCWIEIFPSRDIKTSQIYPHIMSKNPGSYMVFGSNLSFHALA